MNKLLSLTARYKLNMGSLDKTLTLVFVLLVFLATARLALAQTNPLVLDHFDFSSIDSQNADVPFNITITAKDQYNQTLTSYNGVNTLTGHLTITNSFYSQSFGLIGAFINGVWIGEVTLSKGGGTTYFYTNADGRSERGFSNRFFVSGSLLPSVLDHFEFDYISSPQTVGIPFSIRITAEDQYNQTLTGYSGTNTLTGIMVQTENPDIGAWKQISLGSTGAFVNGVWSGQVSFPEAWYCWQIRTNGGGEVGWSDSNIRVYDPARTPTPAPTPLPSPSQTPTPTMSTYGPTSSPTPVPSVPEFSWLIILPLFLSILFIIILIRKRKVSWIE